MHISPRPALEGTCLDQTLTARSACHKGSLKCHSLVSSFAPPCMTRAGRTPVNALQDAGEEEASYRALPAGFAAAFVMVRSITATCDAPTNSALYPAEALSSIKLVATLV